MTRKLSDSILADAHRQGIGARHAGKGPFDYPLMMGAGVPVTQAWIDAWKAGWRKTDLAMRTPRPAPDPPPARK